MIKLECLRCGKEFYCNGDKECGQEPRSQAGCWCPDCSKKLGYATTDFPNCYKGIKERVNFT